MKLKELLKVADDYDIIRIHLNTTYRYLGRFFKKDLEHHYLLEYDVVSFKSHYDLNFGSELIIKVELIERI